MKDKKIILISHGKLAEGMLYSVQMIVGENPDLSCMCMLPGDHYQPLVDAMEKQLKENPDIQYVVIADLLGGSVCNGMSVLTGYPNIKLIAGMNMGLVINLLLFPGALTDMEIDSKIDEAKELNKRIVIEKAEAGNDAETFF